MEQKQRCCSWWKIILVTTISFIIYIENARKSHSKKKKSNWGVFVEKDAFWGNIQQIDQKETRKEKFDLDIGNCCFKVHFVKVNEPRIEFEAFEIVKEEKN